MMFGVELLNLEEIENEKRWSIYIWFFLYDFKYFNYL